MTYYHPIKEAGRFIYIGPHRFEGHTAELIMALGAPVFTRMTHIATLANAVTAERGDMANKLVDAGRRLRDSETRVRDAQALVSQGASTSYEWDAYVQELESAKVQLSIVKGDRDRLAARQQSLDWDAIRVFDACKKVLKAHLGDTVAAEIFRTMGWD